MKSSPLHKMLVLSLAIGISVAGFSIAIPPTPAQAATPCVAWLYRTTCYYSYTCGATGRACLGTLNWEVQCLTANLDVYSSGQKVGGSTGSQKYCIFNLPPYCTSTCN